jgi:hypothetical protein
MKLHLVTLGYSGQVCPLLIDKDVISLLTPHHTSPPLVFVINYSWTQSGIWSVIRFVFLSFQAANAHTNPLNPFSWLDLPSPSQFIIGSSFLQGKPSTSASVLPTSRKVRPYSIRREAFRFISFQSTGVFFLFFRRSPTSWPLRSTQHLRFRSHHRFHRWKGKAARYLHNFQRRAVLGMRVAARSHRSHKSLRDPTSILFTATQSVPRPTCGRLSHYLTYATAVGGSVT